MTKLDYQEKEMLLELKNDRIGYNSFMGMIFNSLSDEITDMSDEQVKQEAKKKIKIALLVKVAGQELLDEQMKVE